MKNFQTPKVALFYDWLNQWGGAERLLLDLIEIFPNSPIYTLVSHPSAATWLPPKQPIITSFINRLPQSHHNPVIYTPIYDIALEQFDFSQYDIVISLTSVNGHCFITPPKTLYVCYCLNPNRYLFQPPAHLFFLKPLLKIYRHIDYLYSRRPDYYLTISQTVAQRLEHTYQLPSQIIYPGVDTQKFTPKKTSPKNSYFLVVSRLVDHKRVDLAITACQQLHLPLKIVGTGRDSNHLYRLAQSAHYPQIEFLGAVNEAQLINLYQNCQALICPQIEDYGYTPLEAQACGRPVIAFNQGGFTETIIPHVTGLFFNHQTTSSLVAALVQFQQLRFSPQECRTQALKFSRKQFMIHFKQSIESLWQLHLSQLTSSSSSVVAPVLASGPSPALITPNNS
jgi:glycosyltransferase involved in cell wall biosynthesis